MLFRLDFYAKLGKKQSFSLADLRTVFVFEKNQAPNKQRVVQKHNPLKF